MRILPSLWGVVLAVSLSPSLRCISAEDGRSDTIRRTFVANPGGRLLIDTDRGGITVEGTEGNQVEIVVERRAVRGSNRRAADLLKRHEVRFTEENGTIRVEADLPDRDLWNWRGPNLEIAIRALVPREFNLEGTTAGGAIRVKQVKGRVMIRTSGGSLNLESVAGTVQGRTSGGSVRAVKLGGTIDLSTSGGSIHVEDVTGDQLQVNTSGGSIRLTDIDAPIEAKTSGGSIYVETSATPLRATTSGGSIHAALGSAPRQEVSLKSSSGGITPTLPGESAFDLGAATSAGGVRSAFPVSVTKSDDRSTLRGPVNGGGPKLTVRTSAGSIRINKS